MKEPSYLEQRKTKQDEDEKRGKEEINEEA